MVEPGTTGGLLSVCLKKVDVPSPHPHWGGEQGRSELEFSKSGTCLTCYQPQFDSPAPNIGPRAPPGVSPGSVTPKYSLTNKNRKGKSPGAERAGRDWTE